MARFRSVRRIFFSTLGVSCLVIIKFLTDRSTANKAPFTGRLGRGSKGSIVKRGKMKNRTVLCTCTYTQRGQRKARRRCCDRSAGNYVSPCRNAAQA